MAASSQHQPLKNRGIIRITSFYSKEGFTLTEILAACTIIAVLLALILPAYRGLTQKAESIKCASNLRQIHTAMMLFFSDYHFFPVGFTEPDEDDPVGKPNYPGKWSPIRHQYGYTWATGRHTNWQIELAKYIGNGMVQFFMYDPKIKNYYGRWGAAGRVANYNAGYSDFTLCDPANAPGYEYDWRLPIEYRCPSYTKKLMDPDFDEDGKREGYRHKLSHYGYCYNQWLATGNGSLTKSITAAEMFHKGRDPRLIATDYSPSNSAANTMFFFCSRWGNIYPKVNKLNESDLNVFDITGLPATGAITHFTGYKSGDASSAAPCGRDPAQGPFCGVSIGIHNEKDNCMFADGHIESLNPNNSADRRRMNKTWHRPLPRDGSQGCYYSDGADARVAIIFDNDGKPVSDVFSSGPVSIPANYNWNY